MQQSITVYQLYLFILKMISLALLFLFFCIVLNDMLISMANYRVASHELCLLISGLGYLILGLLCLLRIG